MALFCYLYLNSSIQYYNYSKNNDSQLKTYIVLLRGINVGGHKKVPMAELRKLLAEVGFINVQTYIQSGNVIVGSILNNQNAVGFEIKKIISAHYGFETSVIVKTRAQFQTIFNKCPFEQSEKAKSYFILLNKIPDNEHIEEVRRISYENEEFFVINDCIYLYCKNGYGKAKFNMNTFERKLKVTATSRNYNTMVKLLSLSAEKDEFS